MNKFVEINGRKIGDDYPCFVTAEVGINHNGSLLTALELIDKAKDAGCDAVKFQKRTVEVVYTSEELATPRENPFGDTNGDLKRGLEFDTLEYEEIDSYCKEEDIIWFASCWDEESVDFIEQFDPPCYKIASASLTDDHLLSYHKRLGKPIILSTGMSTEAEIEHAVSLLDPDNLIILHCTSTYPCKLEEINLSYIKVLKNKFNVPIGYSGHETGLMPTIAAYAFGACMVERHITLDRAMWGSDQAASVEPHGISRIVRDIGVIEQSTGDGIKRVYESEVPIKEKLRRVG